MKTVRTVFPKPYSAFHKQVQTYIPVSGVNGTSPNIKIDNVKPDTTIAKTENNNEGISVCISAWNTAEYIEECLDSVAAQTWFKTHDNWEILLGVDGCEKTLAKVKEIMHKYKNLKVMMMNENVGTYVTCNTIMKEANYEWLMRFDSDDVMPKDMIEKIFKNNLNGISIVRYGFHDFGSKKITKGICYGSCLIRKQTFEKYGGYQNWRIAADFDLIYRLENEVKILILNTISLNRRVRNNSLQFSKETDMKSAIRKKYHEYIKQKTRNKKIIHLTTTNFKKIYDSTPIISFIIPNRNGSNLKYVIENIKNTYNTYNIEIIIVEQDDDKPFKRGQLLNIGIIKCNGEFVIMHDNDVIHLQKVPILKEYYSKNEPFLGFDYISQIKLENNKPIITLTEKNDTGCGAFLVTKKKDILNVNGYSNLYIGWGAEDNEISCRLCNNNVMRPQVRRLHNTIGHISHPKRSNTALVEQNRKRLYGRANRLIDDDGIKQMSYSITKEEIINGVTYVYVNNIGVIDSFKYKHLL